MNKEAAPKQAFHEHYCSDRLNGMEYWVISLIDISNTLNELSRKELYCMYKQKLMCSTVLMKGMSMKCFKNSK